jgi:hypothetical protein
MIVEVARPTPVAAVASLNLVRQRFLRAARSSKPTQVGPSSVSLNRLVCLVLTVGEDFGSEAAHLLLVAVVAGEGQEDSARIVGRTTRFPDPQKQGFMQAVLWRKRHKTF